MVDEREAHSMFKGVRAHCKGVLLMHAGLSADTLESKLACIQIASALCFGGVFDQLAFITDRCRQCDKM